MERREGKREREFFEGRKIQKVNEACHHNNSTTNHGSFRPLSIFFLSLVSERERGRKRRKERGRGRKN